MSEPTDQDLLRGAQAGDQLSWELLVERHAPRLAAYIGARLRRPEVVDKIVADSIYAAWRHLSEVEEPAGFAAWFRRVAANQALRWHKQHKGESLVGGFPRDRCDGDAGLQSRMDELEAALGGLPEAQRMALEQHFRGGLDGDELAEALHKRPDEAAAGVEAALAALDARLQRRRPREAADGGEA